MLKNHSDITATRDCRPHRYQIDDDINQYNDPVYRSLTVGINGVTNTTEEKINHDLPFPHNKQKKINILAEIPGWRDCYYDSNWQRIFLLYVSKSR